MKKTDLIVVISIVLLSLWALQTFFKPGLFETHDGRLHVTKLHWFSEALRQGHFPVRWTETANHQYGYPIFIFYYPLLFYLGSLFVVLGSSLTTAFKILLASTFILSGLLMYRFLREWFSPLPAWVGAILYLFAPYRFVSLFVTGRWAESVSFAVIPLVFLAISKIYKTDRRSKKDKMGEKDEKERINSRRWMRFGTISYALLILSHNAQAMLFTPLVLLFMVGLIHTLNARFRKLFIVHSSLFIVLALGASAFFWLPALYELRFTYQGQKPVYDFRENFPSFRSYLYYPWGYGFSLTGTPDGVSPMIGLAQIGGVGLGVLGVLGVFGRLGPNKMNPLLLLLLLSGTMFFFMNRISLPLWERIPLLPSIQFPSRLTSILVFLAPIIAVLSLNLMRSRWLKTSVAISLVALALYGNRNHLRAAVPDRFNDHDVLSIYQNIFGTGETAGENAPIWSMALPSPYEPNEKFTIHRRHSDLMCLNAWVQASTLEPRNYRVSVVNNTDRSQHLAINTVYYPGWRAYADGNPVSIEPPYVQSENPLGLIRVPVLPGRHNVEVVFGETPLRAGANMASLMSLVLLLSPTFPRKKRK